MRLRAEPRFAVPGLVLVLLAVGIGCASATRQKERPAGAVKPTATQPVAVYPLAGTPDASNRSEISFRGIYPDQLKGIAVVGSKSGLHAGKLEPHSDGMGASFVPAKRFADGELVHVRANVPLVGARKGSVTFRIARPPGALRPEHAFPDGSKPGVSGTNHYISRPDLHPPSVKVTVSKAGASPGYLFMASKSGPGQTGPIIFDNRGRIAWFHPMRRGFKAYDFRTATYQGKPVLTWWQGHASGEYGGGVGVIVDPSYRVIATVRGGNGYPADIHEFRVTPQGTALIVAYRAVRWDLRDLGGPRDRALLDSIAMEIDIKTGHVLFEWHSLGHIPLKESYSHYRAETGSAVDYTHLNSVALDEDGNLLISARNTWTAYKVDRRTGRIIWRLGGKRSTFKLPKYARFVGQHDFTRASDGYYTLFDNANVFPPPKWVSRGLAFSVDAKAHSARLVHAFREPHGRGAVTQGGVQVLPDGNYGIGWGGGIPDVSEFTPGGKLLFDAHLVAKVQSYRAYRFPWSGRPQRPPDVVVRTKHGRTVAYASWNGATGISDWQVLAGSSPDSLAPVAHARWRGFETRIPLPGPARYVSVHAVSDSGTVLGRSKTLSVKG
jgi:hypothetical protein